MRDDQRWIPSVKHTPFDMSGMRLGKYDKPLIHNHKLLSQLYFGEREDLVSAAASSGNSVTPR